MVSDATRNETGSDTVRYVSVFNNADEAAPPFCFLAVVGMDDDGTLLVDQPATDNDVNLLIANTSTAIAAQSYGQAIATWPSVVAYDISGPDANFGDCWGVRAGSWFLDKERSGFVILHAGADASGRRALVAPMKSGYTQNVYATGGAGPDDKTYDGYEQALDPETGETIVGADCWLVGPLQETLKVGPYLGFFLGNAQGRKKYVILASLYDAEVIEWNKAGPIVDGYYWGKIIRKDTQNPGEIIGKTVLIWVAN